MQFIDLKAQYQRIETEVNRRISRVLKHGQYLMGPEIIELEQLLAQFTGARYCIAVSSGTDALQIALMALNIGRGDEVITTPFSFAATAETIALIGARPVFVDIRPDTYNIDPSLIEAALTSRTKAIMPVDIFGQCADYDEINRIAKKYGVPVVEDAAQSCGATYRNQKACSLATIGCTSFFPSKPLGGYGDGGACFTSDENIARKIRQIRDHGQEGRYHHTRIGLNGRLDTLQAAVLLAKLDIFPEEVEDRRRIGAAYSEMLKEAPVITPHIEPHNTSVYAQYTIQVENRDQLQTRMNKMGIPTAVHYPVPLHKQPVFKRDDVHLPVSEEISNRVISLPMHPMLSEKDQTTITKRIIESLK